MPTSGGSIVRRLSYRDEADLLSIRGRALRRAPASFVSSPGDDRFETPGFAAAHLADSQNAVFGAFVDDSIVGIVGIRPTGRARTAHVHHLWGLYVDPEHRRRGLARSLVTRAIEFARSVDGVSRIRLTVTDAAPEAAALYRSLGFVKRGYEPDALRIDDLSVGETSMTLDLAVRVLVRLAAERDLDDIVRLNDAEEPHTSPLDREGLRALMGISIYAKVATVDESVVAFLIALGPDAPYDNDNHRWFASRFSRFVYVDRIVVDSEFSGRGIGTQLYGDLFAHAVDLGSGIVACEYNIDPPNPVSRAFHERLGFREVGTQWIGEGAKRVSLQVAVPPAP